MFNCLAPRAFDSDRSVGPPLVQSKIFSLLGAIKPIY